VHPKSLKPVAPDESTIPSYIWHLPAILTKTFLYHLKIIQMNFPFVSVQAHGALGAIDIFHAKNVLLLDKVYSSQIYEAEAGLENAQFSLVSQFIKITLPPYLMTE
jgi:hypothetical protein